MKVQYLHKVVNETLKFSRPSDSEMQVVAVDALVNDIGEFLINLILTHIDFHMEISNLSGYQVRVNRTQISQIALNLVNNALQAMETNGNFIFLQIA